jgi:hypothetical protein
MATAAACVLPARSASPMSVGGLVVDAAFEIALARITRIVAHVDASVVKGGGIFLHLR